MHIFCTLSKERVFFHYVYIASAKSTSLSHSLHELPVFGFLKWKLKYTFHSFCMNFFQFFTIMLVEIEFIYLLKISGTSISYFPFKVAKA
ncbi:hypothetical protein CW304_18295 [Bacillus sp. UFRGS-B20]|nr:hypothetical protein CW304_18295 [Bacillus sp. UFRGS-B20]